MTLTWTAPATTEAVVSYVLEAGSATGLTNLANIITGSTATIFSAGGVGPGTYFVRIRAQNASGISGASNEAVLIVGGSVCTTAPLAPSGLASTVIVSSLRLTWNAPAGGCAPTSYRIEAGSSSGLSNLAVVDTGSTATAFTASGVGARTYFVRVFAANASGFSGASNEATVVVGTTGPGGCTLGPPAGLASSVSRQQAAVTFTWSPVAGATAYILEAGTTPGSSALATIDLGNTTTYTVSAPPGVYYVRLRSRNDSACLSAPSNETSFVISPPNVL